MEYTSSSSSQGSPEEHQYYLHEHPLVGYTLWQLDQVRLQRTSLFRDTYVADITQHSIRSASNLFRMLTDRNCDCFVFRKVGRCLHVLSFVEEAELHKIMELQTDCSVRSMLFFPTDDETSIFSVLEETSLFGQNEGKEDLSEFNKCPKCQVVVENFLTLSSGEHQCSPEMARTKCSWRCKLPFLCGSLKTYLSADAIMLGPNELHHMIPVVSHVYAKLDELNVRTSIIQILAQDPKYQRTLDILESQGMVGTFFTYHLYLYIQHRLLPYLETLDFATVFQKLIPIFTVIRSEHTESSKDVIGFDEGEEIARRLERCPDRHIKQVRELFAGMSQDYDDEGREVEVYMRNAIQDGFSTSFRTEWAYVVKCLDVKRSVYKGIRRFVNQRIEQGMDGDTWSKRRDFVYGKQDTGIGLRLTNIFGVLPRHRIAGNLLKRALLLSREMYSYDNVAAEKLLCDELEKC